MAKKLSPTMLACIEFAKTKNNKLQKHPGGYWAGPEWKSPTEYYFSTNTVHALVIRELAVYTRKINGRNGTFLVEITLTKAAHELDQNKK